MRATRRVAACALAVLLGSAEARAAGPADQATAVALFQEAKKLMAAGDYEHACTKFVEAQRLFPTPGTLLNIGACYEKRNFLASAWGAYKQAEISARNAGDVERQEAGAKFAAALEGKLSKLTITMAGSAAGIEVRRDGALVGEGQLGTAVPVDPGEHVIEVTAPKRQGWSTKVEVAAGGVSVAVSIPELPPAVEVEKKPADAEGSWWSGQRIAGVAVGGVGVAGLVMGAAFGVQTVSKMKASKEQCSPGDPGLCNATGVALRGEAKTAGTVSTVAFVAGGVLAAGGLVLVLTAPSAKEGARIEIGPRVGAGDVGMMLRGRW